MSKQYYRSVLLIIVFYFYYIILLGGGHPWHSGTALDCWPTGRVIDPAPGEWFIINSSHSPRLSPAQYNLTVQTRDLKHHSLFLIMVFSATSSLFSILRPCILYYRVQNVNLEAVGSNCASKCLVVKPFCLSNLRHMAVSIKTSTPAVSAIHNAQMVFKEGIIITWSTHNIITKWIVL